MTAAPATVRTGVACFHCGEPAVGSDAVVSSLAGTERAFCCHGCQGAAEWIHELGLDAYYDHREAPVKGMRAAEPQGAARFERFDDPALQRSFIDWDDEGRCAATLQIGGMRCAACSWLIEARLERLDGVVGISVGLSSGRARVVWDPARRALSEILAEIARLGYRALPFEPDTAEAMLRVERRDALRRLGVSGLATMQVMMFSIAQYVGAFDDLEPGDRSLLQLASAAIATPVLIYAGWPFLAAAMRDIRVRNVGPDVPIALALLVAYVASVYATGKGQGEVYFDSVCMFIFFITLGRYVERDLRTRAELRVRNLVGRVPQAARRLGADGILDVPVADLVLGDIVCVEAGENIPADGLVVEGRGEVSEALLTGEPTPLGKREGDALLAGSEVLEGALRMRVERTGAASTVQQLSSLLDRAQLEKPPIAVFASRVARAFVASVLVVAAGVGLAWWWVDETRIIPVVVSVLIATCPCALSLATPSALAAATHGLAARGFLITRGHVLETLARVRHAVFDKTGTLTAETPTLVEVQAVREGVGVENALRWARALEGRSDHPMARALRDGGRLAQSSRAQPSKPLAAVPTDVEVEVGAGVTGTIDGRRLRLGRPDWVGALPESIPHRTSDVPATAIVLADSAGPIAWFVFEMPIREGAPAMSHALRHLGLHLALSSGDPSRSGVEAVAARLDISDFTFAASPEVKLGRIDAVERSGMPVLAVGDGINDGPLLGRASVSVAMGSGSDLARLRADAVLLDDRLPTLPLAIRWARRTQRVIRQNFAWAIVYNLFALPLAATGVLAPWQAALGMSLSSLLVVGNSLRLRRATTAECELERLEQRWVPSTS